MSGRITYTDDLKTSDFSIDRRLHIIVWEDADSPYTWAQEHCCAQAHEYFKYSSIRIGQIEIRQSPCCDHIYALSHGENGVMMGKVYFAPHNTKPVSGQSLYSLGRCSIWNEEGDDIISLW